LWNPYNFALLTIKAHASPKRDFNLWIEALNAKYNGVGKPWGRAEFDNIFQDHTVRQQFNSFPFTK
jgi:hypothetical protein